MSQSPKSVALLRGINVGGKNGLPMPILASFFEALGCQDVNTYIQSGNVVYRAPALGASGVAVAIATRIKEQFGYIVPVIVRTHGELAAVVAENPYLQAGADPATLHVMFLDQRPEEARVVELDPGRSPPDRYTVVGREIYMCCPDGFGKTKLTNDYFERKLGCATTVRNWRTVQKLLEMSAD